MLYVYTISRTRPSSLDISLDHSFCVCEEQSNKLATAFGFQNYVTLREYVKIRPALMPYWKKKKQIDSVKSTKTPEKISAIFVGEGETFSYCTVFII